MQNRELINDTIFQEIVKKVRGVSNGTVTIYVFNSRVVKVEVTNTETTRFDDVWLVEDGAGI